MLLPCFRFQMEYFNKKLKSFQNSLWSAAHKFNFQYVTLANHIFFFMLISYVSGLLFTSYAFCQCKRNQWQLKLLANSTKSHRSVWENGCNYNGLCSHVHLSIVNVPLFFISLCCTCGTPIPPNPANMCVACLRTQVDISEGIPKQVTVHFCKQCERFVLPSKIMWF